MPLSFKLFGRPAHPPDAVGKLIVGLGNPGPGYAHNRHNAGFQVVSLLAQAHGLNFDSQRAKGLLASGQVAGRRVILLKPQTYMNLSGEAVAGVARFYQVSPGDILVIYDDLDLPLGHLRLRPDGGSGGHKGMLSVIAELDSEKFPRLRIGIGRPSYGDPVDYLLSDFAAGELPVMEEAYTAAVATVELYLQKGLAAAMNWCNQLSP
jgi:PTH1 family peptidyl-tRNA hydrolase